MHESKDQLSASKRLRKFSATCYFCLCEVCNRIRCPRPYRAYKRYFSSFCLYMISGERCPVIKCDYFEHKQKRRVLRFVRRRRRVDVIFDRLGMIECKLEELARR